MASLAEVSLEQKKAYIEKIRSTPEAYYRKVLKVSQLWTGEIQILNALTKHKKVVVPSGHALGKDFVGGGLPLWFLSSYYPSKVIMTAPTDRQIKAIMWAELAGHYENAGGKNVLGGQLQARKLIFEKDEWFCIAFTTRETKGQIGKFQGFHSPNLLVIISEAQAVDDSIYEQIEGVMTSDNCRIILLGNPLRNTGYFAKAIRGSEYHTVQLDCRDNPNYIEKREVIPGLASFSWCENMKEKYGEGSALYQARVQGILPTDTIDSIISYQSCIDSVGKRPFYPYPNRRKVIVADPATFGDDECVIYAMEEAKIIDTQIFSKKSTTEIAGRCIVMRKKHEAQAIAVDTIGEGRGVADMLVEGEENVVEVKSSHASTEEVYLNCRAEIWFHGKKMIEEGHASLPDDDILIEELTEPKYFVNSKGKFQVEAKEDIKERIGRSTNRADTYLMGLWALKDLPQPDEDEHYQGYRPRSYMAA